MTKDEARQAFECTMLTFGRQFADACDRHDWEAAERALQIIIARHEYFTKQRPGLKT